jgi:hypothetical protein
MQMKLQLFERMLIVIIVVVVEIIISTFNRSQSESVITWGSQVIVHCFHEHN